MKKYSNSFSMMLLFASISFLTNAQQVTTGKSASQARSLSNFNFINLKMSGTVYVKQDDKFSILIEAPSEIIDKITTEVYSNTLEIGNKNKFTVGVTPPIKIYVGMPKPNGLEVDGSGEIITESGITSDFLSLVVNGSGNIKALEVIAAKLNAEVNGSGNVSLSKATSQSAVIALHGSGNFTSENIAAKLITVSLEGSGDVKLSQVAAEKLWMTNNGSGSIRQVSGMASLVLLENSGSGNISANELNGSSISVSNSGSGDVSVGASETLNAQLTGSGDIRYHGNPKTLRKDVTGSGSLNQREN